MSGDKSEEDCGNDNQGGKSDGKNQNQNIGGRDFLAQLFETSIKIVSLSFEFLQKPSDLPLGQAGVLKFRDQFLVHQLLLQIW